jgi:hypothetical protein
VEDADLDLPEQRRLLSYYRCGVKREQSLASFRAATRSLRHVEEGGGGLAALADAGAENARIIDDAFEAAASASAKILLASVELFSPPPPRRA